MSDYRNGIPRDSEAQRVGDVVKGRWCLDSLIGTVLSELLGASQIAIGHFEQLVPRDAVTRTSRDSRRESG